MTFNIFTTTTTAAAAKSQNISKTVICSETVLLKMLTAARFLSHSQNSIRHNLSLHSRFVRIQNEGTGKSSWWMLNPEGGKNGKSPRRRAASMDNNSKLSKSRGRAMKKKVLVVEVAVGAQGNFTSSGVVLIFRVNYYA